MFIYNRAHHKHTEYILRYLNVVRLNEEEKKFIACIARYHRKAVPRNSHAVYAALPYDKRIRVQKLSAILRIANALDCSHKQKVKKISIRQTRDFNFTLTVSTKQNFLLEKTDFLGKKKLFEDITGSTLNLVER
jgi:exopolyphosphatase/guanosine-5'-triphosphate,3'-diphosphate pyrophosphatase